MIASLKKIGAEAKAAIAGAVDLAELEKVDVAYLGRKEGKLNDVLKALKNMSAEDKKAIGPTANALKAELVELLNQKKLEFERAAITQAVEAEKVDTTLPGRTCTSGSLSPLSVAQYELEDIFRSLGFLVLDGPELESDYYNFEALNIPPHHPARDTQDTFYIKGILRPLDKLGAQGDKGKRKEKLLLRTHTSPVQVRAMQKYGVPLRAVVPGRVFRYEALDASHDNNFNQLEGLMVDENISIANLIAVMKTLLRGIFKKDVKVRLRPGYFPFVEPGFELDIHCLICGGKGCSVCKQSGWVELLPCGMVHPNVLRAGGADPQKYSGFAFGLGLTRLVMMRYGIDDIRLLNSGDLRFLKQF